MTSGYRFAVTCHDCGHDLRAITESRHTGAETVAIARCETCGHDWYVTVQLRRLPTQAAERRRRYRARANT